MTIYRGIDLAGIANVIDKNILACIRWQDDEENLFPNALEKRAIGFLYHRGYLYITYELVIDDEDQTFKKVTYKYLISRMNGVVTNIDYEKDDDFMKYDS